MHMGSLCQVRLSGSTRIFGRFVWFEFPYHAIVKSAVVFRRRVVIYLNLALLKDNFFPEAK